MTKSGSLSVRMKGYENISRIYLTKRTPVIIRVDGKAFHTLTRGLDRPFDEVFMDTMKATAKYLCENVSGCKLAYVQSDEISLLLVDYDSVDSQPWFENNLQKLVSISSSLATVAFNKFFEEKASIYCETAENNLVGMSEEEKTKRKKYLDTLKKASKKCSVFDSRAFILPKEEVNNYFVWRQQDATRNSIQMVAQANFPHRELQGKNCSQIQDMLMLDRGINWNDFSVSKKRGTCIVKKPVEQNGRTRNKWTVDENIPIFTQDKDYIERLVYGEEE